MKSYLYGAFLAGVITLGILVGGYAATLVFDIGGRYVISSEEEIREASPVESGVSKKAAIFLRHFRKPIFSRVGEFGRMEKELMRKELLDGYAKDGVLLDEWST
jgi:hypothetical protein